MYLTCQVRCVPLENKFIKENNFPKGKNYNRYLKFPTGIKKTSYKNLNAKRILTNLPYDFKYPIEILCFFNGNNLSKSNSCWKYFSPKDI